MSGRPTRGRGLCMVDPESTKRKSDALHSKSSVTGILSLPVITPPAPDPDPDPNPNPRKRIATGAGASTETETGGAGRGDRGGRDGRSSRYAPNVYRSSLIDHVSTNTAISIRALSELIADYTWSVDSLVVVSTSDGAIRIFDLSLDADPSVEHDRVMMRVEQDRIKTAIERKELVYWWNFSYPIKSIRESEPALVGVPPPVVTQFSVDDRIDCMEFVLCVVRCVSDRLVAVWC